jgi:hypothetical protein
LANDPWRLQGYTAGFDDDKLNMVYLENGWSIKKEESFSAGYGRD